ncbi:hypothetical protein XAC3218_510032 [Xanthomonas citri pv. citri]|nr:hypothetical protein XAC3608_830031 [Xanthomonas citri pv. citri]CEE86111.1 hypothetical protein XAC3218_510032 [Xanthomonas citri pv. citri]CEH93357.1 hypothetical protein XACG115_1280023 [Xanthomonas citri pv. citri]CEI02304.1 hypothetical protein XACB302_5110017 [Xanthomonas citri pv. citri]
MLRHLLLKTGRRDWSLEGRSGPGAARGARPIRKPRKGVYICSPRQGSRLEIFLTCSARFVPGGILGASFHVEYLRAWSYSERLWNSKGGGPALQRHTIRYGTDV